MCTSSSTCLIEIRFKFKFVIFNKGSATFDENKLPYLSEVTTVLNLIAGSITGNDVELHFPNHHCNLKTQLAASQGLYTLLVKLNWSLGNNKNTNHRKPLKCIITTSLKASCF